MMLRFFFLPATTIGGTVPAVANGRLRSIYSLSLGYLYLNWTYSLLSTVFIIMSPALLPSMLLA